MVHNTAARVVNLRLLCKLTINRVPRSSHKLIALLFMEGGSEDVHHEMTRQQNVTLTTT